MKYTSSPEPSLRERKHAARARAIASQGMVLLENNGILPLKPCNISLYGNCARLTIKGGIGSGDVNCRSETIVSIEKGLENAGFSIATKDWLNHYDERYSRDQTEYYGRLIARADPTNPLSTIVDYLSNPFCPPDIPVFTKADLTDTDLAIFVIGRNSGEGTDRHDRPGDYRLSVNESQTLKLLASHYKDLIILLNVGGVIDTSFVHDFAPSAVLLVSQAGAATGDAAADILTGKVNPSGKLTATWAKQYHDYPYASEFSHNNGNLDDSYYKEGIYVGYRWFDTFGISPAYPFGYGLSYTDFLISNTSVYASGTILCLRTTVTNKGLTAGREVVQIYASLPSGKLEKPFQQLVAYAKTNILSAGESVDLVVELNLYDLASYDTSRASYILECGEAFVRVGNSSRHTHIVAKLAFDREIITKTLKNILPLDEYFEETSNAVDVSYTYMGECDEKAQAPTVKIDANDFVTQFAAYKPRTNRLENTCDNTIKMDDLIKGKFSVEQLTAQLSVMEMAKLCVGYSEGGDLAIGNSSTIVPGAAGETSFHLFKTRNLNRIVLSDGPAGLRLTQQYMRTLEGKNIDDDSVNPVGLAMLFSVGSKPAGTPSGQRLYQYATALPIASLLAQTWDVNLISDVGELVGAEMEEFGITLWLAPGMNIHRNPLCGRNFEYYSEDPLVSGLCAAATTRGVQSHVGVGTTIKHFAANNQESNRYFENNHISERALREIYLKGFEICVRDAQPMSVMTSYNLINGIHTANSEDLCISVLRDEWGFSGIVVTDWGTTGKGLYGLITASHPHKYPGSTSFGCIAAGNDLVMPGGNEDIQEIINAVADGRLPLAKLQYCVTNILRLMMKLPSWIKLI